LVEDDPLVRGLTQRLLQRLGYQVHGFADGREALRWLQGPREPVHLLLTDVVMPGMTGKELSEQVRALHPEIAILFSSGYTADVLSDRPLPPGTDFLPKPFTVDELAVRVRRLLDGASPPG
jgi:DNA-binding response OmpR family regulator